MTYDTWKTRSPDDESAHGLPWGDPPEEFEDCHECGGEGGWEQHCRVYEPGCGFAHDGQEWRTCHVCNGTGGMICEATGQPMGLYELEERCGDI